jgi:hypothetical protein
MEPELAMGNRPTLALAKPTPSRRERFPRLWDGRTAQRGWIQLRGFNYSNFCMALLKISRLSGIVGSL